MPAPPVVTEEVHAIPSGVGLWIRLLVVDYLVLALQGSVMLHFQRPLIICHLAPLVAILVGFRQGTVVGAAHGLLIGWLSGALHAEPTGIPMLIGFLLGGLAGAARQGFHLEMRWIRLWLALTLLVVGEILTMLTTLIVWQRLPEVLPLSLIVYAVLAPVADTAVGWLLPGR